MYVCISLTEFQFVLQFYFGDCTVQFQFDLVNNLLLLYLLGNLLVIITVFGWLPKDNVTYIFVGNLSIADLLVFVGCLPLRVRDF